MTYEDYSKACVSYVENLMVKNQAEQNLNQLGNIIAEYKKQESNVIQSTKEELTEEK